MPEPQSKREKVLGFRSGARIKSYYLSNLADGPTARRKAVIRPLGAGGSGVVFLARQILHENVSIKRAIKFFMLNDNVAMLTRHKGRGPISTSDFLNEIVNISAFSHEHLVKVIDAGVHTVKGFEVPFIVTEFVEGPTLEEIIKGTRIMGDAYAALEHLISQPARVIELLIQIGSGLLHLHERSFVHCDIAPKNIFLKKSERYRPVLGDLGVGRQLVPRREPVFVAGSKDYMPPEVLAVRYKEVAWETFEKLQPRWDLYGFAKTGMELVDRLPSEIRPEWRAPLRVALEDCMAGRRYTTLDAMIERLKWLAPIHRETAAVPEISASLSGARRKLMPVESLVTSSRIQRLISHTALLRLSRVPQLTTARYLFPGAVHSRYEHSLGVMETMRRYIISLLGHSEFLEHLSSAKIETALVCALFSNLAKFPFSNVIAEVRSRDASAFPRFNQSDLLREVFNEKDGAGLTLGAIVGELFPKVDMDCVMNILTGRKESFAPEDHLIFSMLNSSLDARVVDYVRRDALHLGLQGNSVNLEDLLPYLTIRDHKLALKITGLSVAEQIISLRYWMFQRVYWNWPNRTLVAMVRYVLLKLARSGGFLEKLRSMILTASEDEVLKFLGSEAKRRRKPDLVNLASLLDESPQGLYRMGFDANFHETPALAGVCSFVMGLTFDELEDLGDNIAENITQFLNPTRALTCVPVLVDFPYEPGGGKLGGDVLCVLPDKTLSPLDRVSGIIHGVNDSFNGYLRRLRVLIHPSLIPPKREEEKRAALRQAIQQYLVSVT